MFAENAHLPFDVQNAIDTLHAEGHTRLTRELIAATLEQWADIADRDDDFEHWFAFFHEATNVRSGLYNLPGHFYVATNELPS